MCDSVADSLFRAATGEPHMKLLISLLAAALARAAPAPTPSAYFATNATSPVLSPEDLVSCDELSLGCSGGLVNLAWRYLEKEGAGEYLSPSLSVSPCLAHES